MFKDHRGTLLFAVQKNNFVSKECTISINKKSVFRGIHIEQFEKVVTCIQGRVIDIIINFNKEDDDYLIPRYHTLDPQTDQYQVFVKKNHGHAFLSLDENSIVVYNFSEIFDATKTRTIHFMDPSINLQLPINNPILSDKDNDGEFVKPIDYIVFGTTGFIGSSIIYELKRTGRSFFECKLRLHEIEAIDRILTLYKPRFVINSAGISTPITWCDTHKIETIETNVCNQLTLAQLCRRKKIHLTIIGSGAIFDGKNIYKEEDEGNFDGNFYSRCRIYLENLIKNYSNVLYIRVNYPISHIPSDKNLITKLIGYKVVTKKNISISYIDQLVNIIPLMIENNEHGICNFVNDGVISLERILQIYSEITGIEHIYELQENNDNKADSQLEIGMISRYGSFPVEKAVQDCIRKYFDINI